MALYCTFSKTYSTIPFSDLKIVYSFSEYLTGDTAVADEREETIIDQYERKCVIYNCIMK